MKVDLEKPVIISGSKPGPKSVILAGVHGNETCGIDAVKKLLPYLKIDQGELTIAFGNPKAITQKVRFIEENLNRMFLPISELTNHQTQSYEFKQAQQLKEILNNSEALLDVHASNNPNSQPFIICEKNASDIYQYLPLPTVVHGFDSVEPGGTDYYMNSIGKVGICIECGYINDAQSTQTAINAIMTFLHVRGHIYGNIEKIDKNRYQIFHLYKTKSDNFTLIKPLADFEEIKKDQIIGLDAGKKIIATEDCIILFAKNISIIGGEAFLLGRKIK